MGEKKKTMKLLTDMKAMNRKQLLLWSLACLFASQTAFGQATDVGRQSAQRPAFTSAAENDGGQPGNLWIANGDRRIYGVLGAPTRAKKQPVAIIAHGFNGSHIFGKRYFDGLQALGYQCFTFDFPCGSLNSMSDNNTMNMSVLDEVSDLKAVINHFRNQPNVDASRIIVIGESQGGLVTALAAAQMPKALEKIVLVYPALCIPDDWRSHIPDKTLIPDSVNIWGVPLGKRYFTEVYDADPFQLIGGYKRPVLILQGDVDPVVPLKYSLRASQTYRKARLHVIKGAGHGFNEQQHAEAMREIEKFLKR